jgi:putative membrane protein
MQERMSEQERNHELLANSRRLVYFAAERTLMAWIRTALGLMALGFVIDRFGLVLNQITPHSVIVPHAHTFSFWIGTLMVVVGAVMALVAAVRYWLFAYNYRHKDATQTGHGIMLGVAFTLILALIGFVVAGFLINVADVDSHAQDTQSGALQFNKGAYAFNSTCRRYKILRQHAELLCVQTETRT